VEGLVDFLDDLLWGAELVGLSLAVGSVAWAWLVLRLGHDRSGGWRSAAELCARTVRWGAIGVAGVQAVDVSLNAWIVAEINGWTGVPAFAGTIQCQAAFGRIAVAIALALCAGALARDPTRERRWAPVTALAVLLVIVGAWLTHAQSRLEDRAALMALTAVHQAAAMAWAGGVAQLLILWCRRRTQPELGALWPSVLRRFSGVGVSAVLVLVGTGTLLARDYIGTLRGLLGTGYGAIVVTKIVLLAVALCLAAANFRASRQRAPENPLLFTRVPALVEGEGLLLLALLLAAAALVAQPPAGDAPDAVPTWAEMERELAPKLPRVISPGHDAVMAAQTGPLDEPSQRFTAAEAWSEFNHNVSGLFILAMGLVAVVDRLVPNRFTRHWPVGFVALGAFLFVRSDPRTWPLGPIPFLTSLGEADVLQHRLATLLVVVLGLVEWRARSGPAGRRSALPYLFPVLSLAGGMLLLTHTHTEATLKGVSLIQLSHTALGLLAILSACGRWLELRLAPPAGRLAGLAATVALVLIGVVLVFYREPIA
jgi:putative copper resistance protein D